MAATEDQESKNDEIDQFINESKLKPAIESGMREKGLNLSDLCALSEQQIDDIARDLTEDEEDQNAFKKGIEDWKAKTAAAKKSTPKTDANGNIIYQIFGTTLTGKSMTFEVTEVMTIGDLKKAIEKKEGIAEKTQKLMYNGQELSNDKATMQQCGIEEEARLHIILTNTRKCCIL